MFQKNLRSWLCTAPLYLRHEFISTLSVRFTFWQSSAFRCQILTTGGRFDDVFSGAKCFLSLIVNDLIKTMLNTWSEFARKRAGKNEFGCGWKCFYDRRWRSDDARRLAVYVRADDLKCVLLAILALNYERRLRQML